jgi:hypothetical protein
MKKRKFEKCQFDRQLICQNNRCPLDDRRFHMLLENWALRGRTLKSINLGGDVTTQNFRVAETNILRKCEVSTLFDNEDIVLEFVQSGRINREVCEEMTKGREEMTNRYFAENNKDFRKACKLAGVEPTTRQASKWRRKQGSAWSAWLKKKHNKIS